MICSGLSLIVLPVYFYIPPAQRWLKTVLLHPLRSAMQHPRDRANYEKDAVSTDTADGKILGAVDGIQSNDELLLTTIKDSLLQTPVSLKSSVDFVTQVLRHRLLSVEINRDTGYPLLITDISTLSNKVKTMILDIVCCAILQYQLDVEKWYKTPPELGSTERFWEEPAYITAVSIIFSSWTFSGDTPPAALDIMHTSLSTFELPAWHMLVSMCCRPQEGARLGKKLICALVRAQENRLHELSFEQALQYFDVICMVQGNTRESYPGLVPMMY